MVNIRYCDKCGKDLEDRDIDEVTIGFSKFQFCRECFNEEVERMEDIRDETSNKIFEKMKRRKKEWKIKIYLNFLIYRVF